VMLVARWARLTGCGRLAGLVSDMKRNNRNGRGERGRREDTHREPGADDKGQSLTGVGTLPAPRWTTRPFAATREHEGEPELRLPRATALVDYHVRRNEVARRSHAKTWRAKHRGVKFLRL